MTFYVLTAATKMSLGCVVSAVFPTDLAPGKIAVVFVPVVSGPGPHGLIHM